MKKSKQGPCSTCGGAHPPDGVHRTSDGKRWMDEKVVTLAASSEAPECNGDKDGCDGEIVEEFDLKIGKKKIRVAITGYHHGSSGHSGPWEYYHVGEIVKRPEGGTEIEELLPDPFDEKPTANDIKKALA